MGRSSLRTDGRDRHTRPARSGKNSLCCALLKCASFFYFKMCIIVSCSARATSAWWPAAGLVPARLPRSRRAQAHSGGAGPGAPAHGQVDVDGHVQQRQAVAARAASKRPEESGAPPLLLGTRLGTAPGPTRPHGGSAVAEGGGGPDAGTGLWAGKAWTQAVRSPRTAGTVGAAGRAPASPDRVVLRGHRLRAVLGLGGGGKARGVSGLNGESSTLRGLLGTHVQAPGRSARGVVVRPLLGRRAPPARARPLGRCSPAGGRGRSQAGSSCRTPGRGRTLRSRRSPAGVCGAPRPGRRGGGLHCDPGRGALTSQSPFLSRGTTLPPTPIDSGGPALSAAASRGWRAPAMAPGHWVGPTPCNPMGAQEAAASSREVASTKRSSSSRAARRRPRAPRGGLRLPARLGNGGTGAART